MSKKMKLSLDGLRVESFVTSLDKKTAGNVKGGTSWISPTEVTFCETVCDMSEMVHCTYFCGGDTVETDVCPETEGDCLPE